MDNKFSKKSQARALLLQKKILVLRELLIKIEKLNIDDRIRFADLIGGICVFIDNELTERLH